MKIFAKFLIIISLVSIMTGCDWLNWNPTYYDEEWVVEKVECSSNFKFINIHFLPVNILYAFDFSSDEKLKNIFDFTSICSIAALNINSINKVYISQANYITFFFDNPLEPANNTSIQFDTTKIFYKSRVMSESFIRPGEIWRCRITTPSMPITYIDP